MRFSGVTLPDNKRIEIALTYIYGIGRSRSQEILQKAQISLDLKVKDLSDAQESLLLELLRTYQLEGDLRRQIQLDIKRLQDIGSYRGIRHRKRLPARGQRTKTNARTKRGKRGTVANKKKVSK